jgi:hypothetical protein
MINKSDIQNKIHAENYRQSMKILNQPKIIAEIALKEIKPLFDFAALEALRKQRQEEKRRLERPIMGQNLEIVEEEYKPKTKLNVLVIGDEGFITKKLISLLKPSERKKLLIDAINPSEIFLGTFKRNIPKPLQGKIFLAAWENFSKYSREKYDFIFAPHSLYGLDLRSTNSLVSMKKFLNDGGKVMITLFSEDSSLMLMEQAFLEKIHEFKRHRNSFEHFDLALRTAGIGTLAKKYPAELDIKKLSPSQIKSLAGWLLYSTPEQVSPHIKDIQSFFDSIAKKKGHKKIIKIPIGVILIRN